MTVKSYAMKLERVSEIYLESQPSNTITRFSFSFFFLLPSTKTKHYFSLQEACQTSAQDCMKIILEAKRPLSTIRIRLLKKRRREVKVDPKLGGQWKDPKLGGQWKVPSLVANGRFQAWWPLEGSKLGGQWKDPKLGGQWKDPKLGGQWKVPSLVANGRFQAWWPLEGSKLGGQWKDPKLGGHWKDPSLVAIGRIQSLVAIGRIQAWWPLEGSKAWWPIGM
jgi:hypothetical protein